MPGVTPVYAFPYQELADPPHGPDLGQDLAEAVETTLLSELPRARTYGGNSDGINNAAVANTTTSSSYVNLGGTSSFAFTKQYAETRLRIDVALTLWVAVAGTTEARVGVRINSVDYDISHLFLNELSSHKTLAGFRFLAGIAAGTYTVQGRWRRVSGTGTLTRGTDDWISIACTEVEP